MMQQKKKSADHESLIGVTGPGNAVRQDRYVAEGKLALETSAGRFIVTNFSTFGLGVLGAEEVNPQTFAESKLFFLNELVGEYALDVRRSTKSEAGWEFGLETITDVIPIEKIQYLMEVQTAIQAIKDRAEKTAKLPFEIRCHVQDLAHTLREYEQVAKSFEAKPYANRADRDHAWDQVVKTIGREVFNSIKTTNLKLQNIIQDQNEGVFKETFHFFRNELGHYIYQSPFTQRSFEKPRGYAGDFEMMNQIYRNDSFAQTLFGSCMEYAVHLHEEPTAVRNRSSYLADKIVSCVNSRPGPLNFLSVACGPAQEVRYAIKNLSQEQLNNVTFWLLDQDEDALKFAQRNIRMTAMQEGKHVNLKHLNKGIKELILEGLHVDTFDLIYSAGLFDYFSDPVAIRAGRTLTKALKPNGTLVIGNFNITSPNWFGMLTLFDWRLILRGESDLERMYNFDGHSMRIECEPENVNLFCVINRK